MRLLLWSEGFLWPIGNRNLGCYCVSCSQFLLLCVCMLCLRCVRCILFIRDVRRESIVKEYVISASNFGASPGRELLLQLLHVGYGREEMHLPIAPLGRRRLVLLEVDQNWKLLRREEAPIHEAPVRPPVRAADNNVLPRVLEVTLPPDGPELERLRVEDEAYPSRLNGEEGGEEQDDGPGG